MLTEQKARLLAAIEDFLDCRILELIHSTQKELSLADTDRTRRARENLIKELEAE